MANTIFLLKAYILGFFGINAAIHSKDKGVKKKYIFLSITLILSFGTLFAVVIGYFFSLAQMGSVIGSYSYVPAFMFAMVSVFSLMVSVYMGFSVIFQGDDYELLMSMPVKMSHIVASKLCLLYIVNLAVSLFVGIPAMAVYVYWVHPPILFYPVALLALLIMPILPLIVGTALGAVVMLVSSGFKHKGVISAILSILVVFGSMALSFSLSFSMAGTSDTGLLDMSQAMLSSLNNIYPLTIMFADAICNLNLISLLYFSLLNIIPCAVLIVITGYFYKSIHTHLSSSKSKGNFKIQAVKSTSLFFALYKKELKRYSASGIYLMNTIFGCAMLCAASIGLWIFPEAVIGFIADPSLPPEMLAIILPSMMAAMLGSANTAAISISLEGKTFPLLKSFPISPMEIFMAKALVNWTILVPSFLFTWLSATLVMGLSPLNILITFLFPFSFVIFVPLFGLAVNLHMPSFDWLNEITVVKQSAPSMIGILGGMFFGMSPMLLMGFVPFEYLYILLFSISAFLLLASFGLFIFLKTKGCEMFAKL